MTDDPVFPLTTVIAPQKFDRITDFKLRKSAVSPGMTGHLLAVSYLSLCHTFKIPHTSDIDEETSALFRHNPEVLLLGPLKRHISDNCQEF